MTDILEISVREDQHYKIHMIHETLEQELLPFLQEKEYVVCIDTNVLKHHKTYLKHILKKAKKCIEIHATEEEKTAETVHRIHTELFEIEASRHTYVLALGGGITGDICGFAAGTYMRGLPYIQIPTTLLSQVDSSIGNKVGVNAFQTKNTIGMFYAPIAVFIDIHFLETLTTRLFREGFVELIKHGYINRPELLSYIEKYSSIYEVRKDVEGLKECIMQSLSVKKHVVEQDPKDQGRRHILNFGHTFGHALELTKGNTLYHGESVAIGMLVASRFSDIHFQIQDTTHSIFNHMYGIFKRFGCLKPFPNVDFEKMKHDKKRQGSFVKEVVLSQIGEAHIQSFSLTELRENYERIYTMLRSECTDTIANTYAIYPSKLSGNVLVPPSKSYAHRLILSAALSGTRTILHNVSELSEDVHVTLSSIHAFGMKGRYDAQQQSICIEPQSFAEHKEFSEHELFMNESGTSLRLIFPLLFLTERNYRITGTGKLPTRPMDIYLDLFQNQDVTLTFETEEYLPVHLSGTLKGGTYRLRGDISSQFISGLLMTLPCLPDASRIELTTPLESIPYVQMTLTILKQFGIDIHVSDDYTTYEIKGNQTYTSKGMYDVEQDYSSRAFLEVLQSMDIHDVQCIQQREETLQGDVIASEIIQKKLHELDLRHVPDLAPIMAIYFARHGGTLYHTERLQYKESNRLEAIMKFLDGFGVRYTYSDNTLCIEQKKDRFTGGYFDTYNDHRILMSLLIGATYADAPCYTKEIESHRKSYMKFLDDYLYLGGCVDEE